MNETPSIEFVLHGKVEGVEITPRTIGLSQFNEFNLQVEAFIGGSQKLRLDQVHLEIAQSSYVLRALLTAVVLSSLEPDLRLMAREDVLGELDFKRAEVVQHYRTGDLRNVHLISFVDYHPSYNEEALDRFAAKGAEAWAGVPDAAQWVRDLRGR